MKSPPIISRNEMIAPRAQSRSVQAEPASPRSTRGSHDADEINFCANTPEANLSELMRVAENGWRLRYIDRLSSANAARGAIERIAEQANVIGTSLHNYQGERNDSLICLSVFQVLSDNVKVLPAAEQAKYEAKIDDAFVQIALSRSRLGKAAQIATEN